MKPLSITLKIWQEAQWIRALRNIYILKFRKFTILGSHVPTPAPMKVEEQIYVRLIDTTIRRHQCNLLSLRGGKKIKFISVSLRVIMLSDTQSVRAILQTPAPMSHGPLETPGPMHVPIVSVAYTIVRHGPYRIGTRATCWSVLLLLYSQLQPAAVATSQCVQGLASCSPHVLFTGCLATSVRLATPWQLVTVATVWQPL